ncbi:MAG: glycosyltransferase family 4 protein [Candidatus Eremiobacterota bacterium]
MKVLFIHQFFTAEDEPGEVRHIAMFKYLLDKGYDFTIIGGSLNYFTGKNFPDFKGIFHEKEPVPGKIKLLRVCIPSTYRKGFIGKIFCYITFLILSFVASFKTGPCDIILTTSPSLLTALAGYMVSRIKGVPCILEVRDLWPKAAAEMGLIKNKFLICFASLLEKFLYNTADRIVVITKGYADYIESRGINASKINIVYNGVDEWMLDYPEETEVPEDMKRFSDKFIVMHVGGIGKFNYLHDLLYSVELLEEGEKFAFVFIGDGAEKEKLANYSRKKNLTNIHFLGIKKRQDMAKYLNLAHATVAIYPPVPAGKLLLQNKVLDYLSMGKPVLLVSEEGDTGNIIEEGQCGFRLGREHKELAEKLMWCLENREKCKEMGRNGREYVRKYLNRKKLAEDMDRIFKVELI